MRLKLLLLFIILNLVITEASADIKNTMEDTGDQLFGTTMAPFAVTGFTLLLSVFYTQNRPKIIIEAKPDANAYVASNGQINSVYLEKTLIVLREKYPNTSDMQLAKAIIAY